MTNWDKRLTSKGNFSYVKVSVGQINYNIVLHYNHIRTVLDQSADSIRHLSSFYNLELFLNVIPTSLLQASPKYSGIVSLSLFGQATLSYSFLRTKPLSKIPILLPPTTTLDAGWP